VIFNGLSGVSTNKKDFEIPGYISPWAAGLQQLCE
jgi:hypothetical protein